jgi:hypothetical protein
MAPPFFAFLVRRMRAHARLEALVAAGALAAAALMAAVFVYADAVRDLGLAYALGQHPAEALDVTVYSSSQRLTPSDYAVREEETRRQLRSALGGVASEYLRYGRTATFFLTPPGAPVPQDDDRPRAHFQFFDGLEARVRVLAGRPPKVASPAAQGAPVVEVWVSSQAAQQLDITVGDRFDLHPFWALDVEPVHVEVVGVFEPVDPADRAWRSREERLAVTSTRWPTYPFFVPEATVTGALVAYLPSIDGAFETIAVVDTAAIDSRNAPGLADRLRALAANLPRAVPRTQVDTELPAAIELYRTKLFFTRLPLFALVVQILGIVLLYLVLVSSLLADRRSDEWALLQSRGASPRHVLLLAGAEAALIALPAALLGPPAAAAGTALLGYTPAFRSLSGGSALEVTLSAEAWGMALLGAAVAAAAIAVPAARSGRRSLVQLRQAAARPPQQPAFLRYYLDVGVLAIAAAAAYQLRAEGSLARERLLGGAAADPVLLAAPSLFMLAVGLADLRLLPLALRAAAGVARFAGGVALPLALWQVVRRPLHHSRLMLLLMLATAVGVFAAGFRATLERSYDDRAAYEAAAPARVVGLRPELGVGPDSVVGAAAVALSLRPEEIMPAIRADASYALGRFHYADLTVLGLVPEAARELAFWRSDFASRSLASLMGELRAARVESVAGLPIPADAVCLGLRAKLPPELPRARLGVRLRSPDARAWALEAIPVGSADADGWQLFVVPVSFECTGPEYWRAVRTSPPDAAPLLLDAVYLRPGTVLQAPLAVAWYVDEILAGGRLPDTPGLWEAAVIESFERLEMYEPIGGVSSAVDPGSIAAATPAGGHGRAVLVRARMGPGGTPISGLRPRQEAALPVLASSAFLGTSRLRVGDEFELFLNAQVVRARIVGSFRLFPGYRPEDDPPLLVTDLATLRVLASRLPVLADVPVPNELWLHREPPQAVGEAPGIRAESLLRRSELRAAAESDPLVAASWEGILFLSFASVLGLTAIGFAAYAYLAAERRAFEFAVLRTIGLSPAQVFVTLFWEHAVVIATGLAVGTALGFPLGRLMVEYLAFTETGEAVVPPLIAEIRWQAVAALYAVVAAVFLGTMVALAALYARLALHRTLRLGEA